MPNIQLDCPRCNRPMFPAILLDRIARQYHLECLACNVVWRISVSEPDGERPYIYRATLAPIDPADFPWSRFHSDPHTTKG